MLDLSSLSERRLPEPSSSSSSSSSAGMMGVLLAALAKMLVKFADLGRLKRLIDLLVLKMLTDSLLSLAKMFLRRKMMLSESISSLGG